MSEKPEKPTEFQINLDLFSNLLSGDINSDLTALKIIIDCAKNYPEASESYKAEFHGMTAVSKVPPEDFLVQREFHKCFKSIMSSVQDYLDKLIAVIRLMEQPIVRPPGCTVAEASQLIQDRFDELLLVVAMDRKQNIQTKLDLLLGTETLKNQREALQSLFGVRNGLEHHKGISKDKKVLTFKRLGMATKTGEEIIPPMTIVDSGIYLRLFDVELVYDKGGRIILTKSDIDLIVLNLMSFIIPALKNETVRLIQEAKKG